MKNILSNIITHSLLVLVCLTVLITSCNQQDNITQNEPLYIPQNKVECLNQFAKTFSKVIYSHKAVREFIKHEALKQFDKNYDVLYISVMDQYIGDKTFRDILVQNSSEEIISQIEEKLPRLNIYIPKIPILDVYPEQLNTDDNQIPVVVHNKSSVSLYIEGKDETNIEKGQLPNFHTFVINENSRVIVPTSSSNLKSANTNKFHFISPAFDGAQKTTNNLKSIEVSQQIVGQKAIDAYHLQTNSPTPNQVYQRDYIYYGVNPNTNQYQFNKEIQEYLTFIQIYENTYCTISGGNNPHIKNEYIHNKKRELTKSELIEKMWSDGTYNIRFEILDNQTKKIKFVTLALRPEEIWDFNIKSWYRHKTTFRHSKYYYKISERNFKSKKIFLSDKNISFGSWNYPNHDDNKYIRIYSFESNSTEEFEKWNFEERAQRYSGQIPYDPQSREWSVSMAYSSSLAAFHVYYTDPIIAKINDHEIRHSDYSIGMLKFGITARYPPQKVETQFLCFYFSFSTLITAIHHPPIPPISLPSGAAPLPYGRGRAFRSYSSLPLWGNRSNPSATHTYNTIS